MKKISVDGLIDGVYAIVMTLLILSFTEPNNLTEININMDVFLFRLKEYILTFSFLLSFWITQRRTNVFSLEANSRFIFWLNGLVLLLISLVPYSMVLLDGTKFYNVHIYEIPNFGIKIRYEIFVDLFFIGIWFFADAAIHLILFFTRNSHLHKTVERKDLLYFTRQRATITFVLYLVFIVFFILPGHQDRNVLFFLPLLLIFEGEILLLVNFIRNRMSRLLR